MRFIILNFIHEIYKFTHGSASVRLSIHIATFLHIAKFAQLIAIDYDYD